MIAVLGRGQSLKKYSDLHSKYDKVYIVNQFKSEIDLLGIDKFKDKDIIHVVGRGKNSLGDYYKLINLIRIQSNSASQASFKKNHRNYPSDKLAYLSKGMLERGYPPADWKKVLKLSRKLNFPFLRQKLKEISPKFSEPGWPTTGILAIDLALFENNPKTIDLFGFDLYKEHYLVKKNQKYQNSEWDKSKAMTLHLSYLCNEFSETSFNSYSSVEINHINWINKG